MHKYQVGEPYNPARTNWPETSQYNFRAGQHEIVLFMASIKHDERMAVKQAPCEFGLIVEGDVIFFLYRFGDEMNRVCSIRPGDIDAESESGLPQPETSTETRALLHVLLVEATTGIVKAIRVVTLSPEFTAALHHAIYEQAERPFPVDYDSQIAAAYEKYPTSIAMARAALRTMGGA